jgi:hypothetical protein
MKHFPPTLTVAWSATLSFGVDSSSNVIATRPSSPNSGTGSNLKRSLVVLPRGRVARCKPVHAACLRDAKAFAVAQAKLRDADFPGRCHGHRFLQGGTEHGLSRRPSVVFDRRQDQHSRGTSEIWRAFATSTLTNVTVTATLSQSIASSITVMSFKGVDTSGTSGSGAVGAIGSGNVSTGAPSASLVTTRNNSWVFQFSQTRSCEAGHMARLVLFGEGCRNSPQCFKTHGTSSVDPQLTY